MWSLKSLSSWHTMSWKVHNYYRIITKVFLNFRVDSFSYYCKRVGACVSTLICKKWPSCKTRNLNVYCPIKIEIVFSKNQIRLKITRPNKPWMRRPMRWSHSTMAVDLCLWTYGRISAHIWRTRKELVHFCNAHCKRMCLPTSFSYRTKSYD